MKHKLTVILSLILLVVLFSIIGIIPETTALVPGSNPGYFGVKIADYPGTYGIFSTINNGRGMISKSSSTYDVDYENKFGNTIQLKQGDGFMIDRLWVWYAKSDVIQKGDDKTYEAIMSFSRNGASAGGELYILKENTLRYLEGMSLVADKFILDENDNVEAVSLVAPSIGDFTYFTKMSIGETRKINGRTLKLLDIKKTGSSQKYWKDYIIVEVNGQQKIISRYQRSNINGLVISFDHTRGLANQKAVLYITNVFDVKV